MTNATSDGKGQDRERDGRGIIRINQILREHDCIWCMACVSVCPPQAIKVDQSNLEYHEKSAGTFSEELAKECTAAPCTLSSN